MTSIDKIEAYDGYSQLVSCHVFKTSAQIAAQRHHDWRALQEEVCYYFPHIGWDDCDDWRKNFNIIEWCKTNNILVRLRRESNLKFKKKLKAEGYLSLFEEYQCLIEELERTDEENSWEIKGELERRAMVIL